MALKRKRRGKNNVFKGNKTTCSLPIKIVRNGQINKLLESLCPKRVQKITNKMCTKRKKVPVVISENPSYTDEDQLDYEPEDTNTETVSEIYKEEEKVEIMPTYSITSTNALLSSDDENPYIGIAYNDDDEDSDGDGILLDSSESRSISRRSSSISVNSDLLIGSASYDGSDSNSMDEDQLLNEDYQQTNLFQDCKINIDNRNITISKIVNNNSVEEPVQNDCPPKENGRSLYSESDHYSNNKFEIRNCNSLNAGEAVEKQQIKTKFCITFNRLAKKPRKWNLQTDVDDEYNFIICSTDNLFQITPCEFESQCDTKVLSFQDFKLPPVPLKKPVSNIEITCNSSNERNVVDLTKDDDVLSIYGDSIIFNTDEEFTKISVPSIDEEPPTASNDDIPCVPPPSSPPIQWVQENNPISIKPQIDSSDEGTVQRWIQTNVPVPIVYKGLCYNYFLSRQCKKPVCNLSHKIHPGIGPRMLRLSSNDLIDVYKYTKENSFLFEKTWSIFAEVFNEKNMKTDLINMIYDSFFSAGVNIYALVDKIVEELIKSGMTIQEAMEFIIIQTGLGKFPKLVDILIKIISFHSVSSASAVGNWDVIKKLLIGRIDQLDNQDVARIITNCVNVYPVNRTLSTSVMDNIINKNLVDTSKIKRDLLVSLRLSCGESPKNSSPPKRTTQNYDHKNFTEKLDEFIATSSKNCSLLKSGGSDDYIEDNYYTPSAHLRKDSEHNLNETFSVKSFDNTSSNSSGESNSEDENPASPAAESTITSPEENLPTTNQSPQVHASNSRRNSRSQLQHELCPRFGKLVYHEDFKLNVSVHNLYPYETENVTMNDNDVIVLDGIIKSRDGTGFLLMLETHRNPVTVQGFVCMVIANLRRLKSKLYEFYHELLESIEKANPNFMSDNNIKAVLEVITFNIIFELDNLNHHKEAGSLLHVFTDWDSLISSKILRSKYLSHMGRYIYIAKLLGKIQEFYWLNEIFQNDHLNLLRTPQKWPYSYSEYDISARNLVLKEFFEKGIQCNAIVINDMFKNIFTRGFIFGYNALDHLNPMFQQLFQNQNKITLKYFEKDLHLYLKYLDKSILHSFLLQMYSEMSEDQMVILYDKCADRGLYPHYNGSESTITVKTNMSNEDIGIILKAFFHKMFRSNFQKKIVITIALPENVLKQPKSFQNVRSLYEINRSVVQILATDFKILVNQSDRYSSIVIYPDMLSSSRK